MDFIEKLGKLAGKLDEEGLVAQADAVDRMLEKIALNERQFDIDLHYVVYVRADLYNKVQDPSQIPVTGHVKADGTIEVHPVQNGQVVNQVLFTQKFTAHNLNELRSKMATVVSQLKAKFAPASADETIEYKPVAGQAPASGKVDFTMGPATVR